MRRRSTARCLAAALVAVLLVAGCGDDDAGTAAGGSGDMGGGQMDEMSDMTETTEGREADRVVEVRMLPGNRFDPATIAVETGETVTFRLVNEDDTLHEFMLGDEAMQAEHEKEMMEMSSEPMEMDDEANAVTVRGGQTKELTWTFEEAGTTLYGCHQPGHYAAGEKGTITVS